MLNAEGKYLLPLSQSVTYKLHSNRLFFSFELNTFVFNLIQFTLQVFAGFQPCSKTSTLWCKTGNPTGLMFPHDTHS